MMNVLINNNFEKSTASKAVLFSDIVDFICTPFPFLIPSAYC